MPFKFEQLLVWHKAVDLSDKITRLVKSFPRHELFILTRQIKKAADAVSLHIAEGSTGQPEPEFKRCLGIALRSCIEVVGCIFLARRRGYLTQHEFEGIYRDCEEILALINTLKLSLP